MSLTVFRSPRNASSSKRRGDRMILDPSSSIRPVWRFCAMPLGWPGTFTIPHCQGCIGSSNRLPVPLLVYQWLDGELLRAPRAQRDDPESAFQRFRSLPAAAIQGCLDAIFDLHDELAGAGWIAVDFYDGCLIYDFKSGSLGIVDLDTYNEGPFRNEMGRMFGSTRFMAPEEFELGALIDQQTNVFVMGRTALVFLSDGTLNAGAFRGTRALFEIVARACESERSRRYDSMA
jgi:serine/threonine protein kinase, bacterial